MIPIRRAHIVKEAKSLTYPEGTACAEVLISGEKGGTTAKTVFAGLGFGRSSRSPTRDSGSSRTRRRRSSASWYDGGNLSAEVIPALLGRGLHHRDPHRR